MSRPDVGTSCHGKKRPAEHEPDADQPLAKKFGRLQIGIKHSYSCVIIYMYLTRLCNLGALAKHSGSENQEALPPRQRSSGKGDAMLLDDTKDTTYIHDLEREIAEIEEQERQVSSLPGIVDKLTSIPKTILADTKPQNSELILYREPKSLPIPEKNCYARETVTESKEGARMKGTQHRRSSPDSPHAKIVDYGNRGTASSEDAMDIDVEL